MTSPTVSIASLKQFSIPYVEQDASWYTFSNGFSLVHVPKKGEVYNLSTWVKTGSIHEDEVNNGVSHFLEHLMFKGTERFAPGQFDRKMESMGAVINAATGKDFTFYYIAGPKGEHEELFDVALDMHADMLLFSTLPEAEIGPQYDPNDPTYVGEKRERAVVIEEIGMRDDQPWTKVYNNLNAMMYPQGHPYQRDVIGTREIIGQIPRESIVSYYHNWYSPHTMTTIVVGDFAPQSMVDKILNAFNFDNSKANPNPVAWLRHDAIEDHLKPHAYLNHQGKAQSRWSECTGDYQTSFFLSGFHGPEPDQLKEIIALDIASYVLGESRSARLTQALIEQAERPAFNTISSGQSVFRLGSVYFLQGNFNQLPASEALAQVKSVLNDFLTRNPITEDEFGRAVKKLKVDFAETSETASGIAEALGDSLVVTDGFDTYTRYLDILTHLDVETVRHIAQTYLNPEKMYTSVLVPAA